ncbi:MAG: SagB/ThcOx family dehydrogenase [Deltaproteobacteria bacterium]|nr:SagB/ThcOx family dehydrogenase [Deltaproteobacteria bacterium]
MTGPTEFAWEQILDGNERKMNPNTPTAAPYHHLTSYQRHNMSGHVLDWENQPDLYKTYSHAESVPLPKDVRHRKTKLSQVLKEGSPEANPRVPDMDDLARIFSLAYSMTAKARHGGADFYYRSAASAGALYPTEIYAAASGVQGLDDGLYHFSVARHSLFRLRKGDLSSHIAGAIRPTPRKSPILTFFLSAILFRSAWKYRERSYRYHLLDTGHVAENLIVTLKALEFPSVLSYDFDDHAMNRLLGLDERKEVCLLVCYVPGNTPVEKAIESDLQELPKDFKSASQVAHHEIDYPAVREIHEAGSSFVTQPGSGPSMADQLGLRSHGFTNLGPPNTWPETMDWADAFRHRRSRRNFVPHSISQESARALVACLALPEASLSSGVRDYSRLVGMGFLAGNVDHLDPGFYLLDASKGSFGMVRPGVFTDKMAHVCLNQAWLAHAALHFLFMADLDALDQYWGARGYRYAMLESGRLGERLYLAATAMGLGCCGIGAFYDFEAAELLGLKKGSRLFYLVGVGPVRSIKIDT